jgi:hypothetical protein
MVYRLPLPIGISFSVADYYGAAALHLAKAKTQMLIQLDPRPTKFRLIQSG